MYPYPTRIQPEKVYHTAEGHAAALAAAAAAAACIIPPPLPPQIPPIALNFNMNPASYENVDNVDWALLAQQWIQMQDPMPAAPPPPIFTTPGIVTRQIFDEKGEADMDVEMEPQTQYPDDHTLPSYDNHAPASNHSPWVNPPPSHGFSQPPVQSQTPWNKPAPHQNSVGRSGLGNGSGPPQRHSHGSNHHHSEIL